MDFPGPIEFSFKLEFVGEEAPSRHRIVEMALTRYEDVLDDAYDDDPNFVYPGRVFAKILNEHFEFDRFGKYYPVWKYTVGVGELKG